MQTLEHAEDLFAVLGSHSDPVVLDGELPPPGHPFGRNFDDRCLPFRLKLHRIGNQVLEDLLQRARIGPHRWQRPHLDRGRIGFDVCAQLVRCAADHIGDGHIVDLRVRGVDPREFQQVVNERPHVGHAILDIGQILLSALVQGI